MDSAPEKKPSRLDVFLGWLAMLEKSPQEHMMDYLDQVETRLRRLEKSHQRDNAANSPNN